MRINRIPLKKTRKDQIRASMKMMKELKGLSSTANTQSPINQAVKTAKTIDINNSPEPRKDFLTEIEKELAATVDLVNNSPIRISNKDL